MGPRTLEGLIKSLLEAFGDKEESVRSAVSGSLRSIGTQQHALLLSTAQAYLTQQPKLDPLERTLILRAVEEVCSDVLPEMEDGLAGLLVNLATQEMTMTKDFEDPSEDWQEAACRVLVTLSRRFPHSVLDTLLQKFQPGFLPHIYVPITLGAVATNNAFGFIPFFSDILSRMIPMLPTVKPDALRRAFVVAVREGCESLQEYLSNLAESPDPSVTAAAFEAPVAAAYEHFVAHWLSSKDPKLRVAVAEAVGAMARFLPPTKFHEELKRLFPALLTLYKKSPDHYHITKGLCGVLEAAVLDDACPLEPYLEEVWSTIFPQVCEEVDYSNSAAVKNQSEIHRCFHVTATRVADKLVYYLLQKMGSGQEKSRLGALGVLRHLVNSSGPFMDDKRSLLLLGLKPILHDPASIKVKKVICQLGVALADHDYLEGEGGDLVIAFLVDNLIAPEEAPGKKTFAEDVSGCEQVRSQCAQALFTIASNIQSSDELMWVHLLEAVCTEPAGRVLTDIFRPLGAIAERKKASGALDWADLVKAKARVAGVEQVVCRLVVALGAAEKETGAGRRLATAALGFLRQLPAALHSAAPPAFAAALPGLQLALEDDAVGHEAWQATVLEFLTEFVVSVSDGEWRQGFAAAMGSHFSLYNAYPKQKAFLFRCLGGLLGKIEDRPFTINHLDLMFRSINQANHEERQGCARGVGYCAAFHTDLVLTKLENVSKWEHQKKTGGILGFIKDNIPVRTESDMEMSSIRASIMLSYGFLLYYCPVDIVTQRLDSTVLRFLKPHFEKPKDVIVMEALVRTSELVAKTLHPTHLKADYTFLQRDLLLQHLKDYVSKEGTPELTASNLRRLACDATAALLELEPVAAEEELWGVLSVLCTHVFPLTAAKGPPTLIPATLAALNALFARVMKHRPTAQTLSTLVKLIQSFVTSTVAIERERALGSLLVVLEAYFAHATDVSLGRASEFAVMGGLLGRLGPRLCDSGTRIRTSALAAVALTLRVGVLHKGLGRDHSDVTAVADVSAWEALAESADQSRQMEAVAWLGGVAEARLTQTQVQTYLSVLLEALSEPQAPVALASATLLRLAIDQRGPHLSHEAGKIVEATLEKLGGMESVRTYAECLQSVHSLASHHLQACLAALLVQPLPYSQAVVDAVHAVSRDGELAGGTLEWALEAVEEARGAATFTPEGSPVAFATPKALRAPALLLEIVKGAEPESEILAKFGRILAGALLLGAALAPCQYPMHPTPPNAFRAELRKIHPKPGGVVVQLVKSLLIRTRQDEVLLSLNARDEIWADLQDQLHFPQAVADVAGAVGEFCGQGAVEELVGLLEPALDGVPKTEESDKMVAVAAFGPFVKAASGWEDGAARGRQLHILVSALMKGLADTSLGVRRLSVRGLGSVAHCGKEDLELYRGTAVSGMMAGLEDPKDFKDDVALEAMQGLSKLSGRMSKAQMEPIFMPILLRLRPCFEKESGALRSVAFGLLGKLARFGSSEAFREQLQVNLIALLLHLNDEEPSVRDACSDSLEALASVAGIEELGKAVSGMRDGGLNYAAFLHRAAAAMVNSDSGRLNQWALSCSQYVKSGAGRIRANAALLTGALLGAAPDGLRGTVSKDLVFSELALLLKDPDDVEVRTAAAAAIAHLHSY